MGVLKQQKETLSELFFSDFKSIFCDKKENTAPLSLYESSLSSHCWSVSRYTAQYSNQKWGFWSHYFCKLEPQQWFSTVKIDSFVWFWAHAGFDSHLKMGNPYILLIKVSVTAAVMMNNNNADTMLIQRHLKNNLQSQGEFSFVCDLRGKRQLKT